MYVTSNKNFHTVDTHTDNYTTVLEILHQLTTTRQQHFQPQGSINTPSPVMPHVFCHSIHIDTTNRVNNDCYITCNY
jgi:hypothetical protein